MEFSPTYLYIKQHAITGLLYFGKTTKSDPIKYLGSGKYWKRHIKKHGREHIVTLWFEMFTNKDELITFATEFSKSMAIVESKSWANLIPENGLDGGPGMAGKVMSKESRLLMSMSKRGLKMPPRSNESKRMLSALRMGAMNPFYGHKHSAEAKELIGKSSRERIIPTIICQHCGKEGQLTAMSRWHLSNCKFRPCDISNS